MKSWVGRNRHLLAVALAWLLMAASLVSGFAIEQRLAAEGRADLASFKSEPVTVALFSLAILGAAVVGTVLAVRRPSNMAGWLFLAFALSISLTGLADSYGLYGAHHNPGSLPGAALVAVYGDGAFLAWVCLLTLILLVTPSGSAPSARWKSVGWLAAASGVVFALAIPFRSTPLEAPLQDVRSPLIHESYAELAEGIALAAVVAAHLALLGAVGSIFYRARHSSAEERQQLRWLLVPAIPFPFLVVGAWFAAATARNELLALLAGGYLLIIPISAAMAIEKRRLYDIDRIISRTVTYTLLSGLVVAGYIAVVVTIGIEGGEAASESVPAAVAATTVAILLGGISRKSLQDAVDRRFNRRAFGALEQVRRYVRQPDPALTIERVFRAAAGDPGLSVTYWSEDRSAFVKEDGTSAPEAPAAMQVLTPEGERSAAINFDESLVSKSLVAALAAEARPELENARLRAAISIRLVEVQESRNRIVAAQLEERRRIERDLHDGSQQRLLALAMNLRAAEFSGDAERALAALPAAIGEIQETVRELRELANGLHPGILESGGLPAALQELAARAPIPIRLDVLDKRLPAPVEAAAWFICCEAVTNIVKHAQATTVVLRVQEEHAGALALLIEDDGVGGADSRGNGLRGIADRAEAAGGSLYVDSGASRGTSIRAVLPCG